MRQFHTKSAHAASVIRRALSKGVYAAGEHLTTTRLSKDLGLTMTPIREALIELANEGLVEISPHRGARVADLGMVDLSDLYLTRGVLEPAATAFAVKNLNGDAIAELKRIHDTFVAAVKRNDADAMLELNQAFHFAIYDAAGSPLLNRLIRLAWSSSPNDTFRLIPKRARSSVRSHAAILRAVTSGDPALAENEMRKHIAGALKLIGDFKKTTKIHSLKGRY
jgi:DNA-binding GntR family transcriptional regulator